MTDYRNRLASLALGLAMLVPLPIHAQEEDAYRLHDLDQLRVRALIWMPNTSSFEEWRGLNGDYTVSSDGMLSLPLIAPLQATGRTLGEISQDIGRGLQLQIGSPQEPRLAIEIVGHRPVYVLGAAQTPGAYRFEPGLTAQQALAQAGGLRRLDETAAGGFQGIYRAEGEARVIAEQLAARKADRLRLQRELAMLDAFDGGADPAAAAAVDTDASREIDSRILDAARSSTTAEVDTLQNLEEFLVEQIAGLEAQKELLSAQIARVEDDIAGMEQLREQGLAAASRVTGLASTLTSLKSDSIQIDIALLNAQQQLSRTQRDELTLFNASRAQALTRLAEVEEDIATLEIRLETARLSFNELAASTIPVDDETPNLADAEIEYRVTREVDGTPETAVIAATDRLQPGDTLEVERIFGDTGVEAN